MKPPQRPLRFLRWFCRADYLDEIEGDLTEIFIKQAEANPRYAKRAFAWSVITYFRPEFIKSFQHSYPSNSYSMLTSYFKIGWRNIMREKSYSVINVGGLTLGMTVAMLIALWSFDEWSFNRSFANHDRIAQVYHNLHFGEGIYTHGGIPNPMGSELKNFAEFEAVVMATEPEDHTISSEQKKFSKTAIFVTPQFIDMFSVHLLQGTNAALKDMRSIVLCRTLAEALGGDDAVGKIIKLDNRDDLMVAGVFEDFPVNSEFADIKMLLPLEYYFSTNKSVKKLMNSWEDYMFQCFVQLSEGASFAAAESKIKNFLYQKASADGKAIKPEGFLFPMEKWHLYAEFKDGENTGGQIQFVSMFGIVGVFVLLLACINFMNLSTARSEKRSKEVGIRKVMGSVRRQLTNQFLSESFLMVVLAFLITLVLVVLCLPWFNELTNKRIIIPWGHPYFICGSLAFVLITSILAGSYPAWYLSSLNPVKVLKGTFKTGRFAAAPRKVMVAFQFTISISLIMGTIVIFQQIQHAKNRPVGFDREGILQIEIRSQDLARANYNSLRNDLLSCGVVENVAQSDFPMTGSVGADPSITWEGKDPANRPLIAMNSCSHDFPKTNGFQFVEGRDFSRDFRTDSSAVIINEMAARLISEGSPVGKKIRFGNGKQREIIGVIKDQIRSTPFLKQLPHVYYLKYSGAGYLTIRMKPDAGIRNALDRIEAVLKKYDPGTPFDYVFQDDDYAQLFKNEERIGTLASLFAALAIGISCLGIFGLASFIASSRTKEIGIRKVLGASVFSVWKLLSREFVWLITVSILLAIPLSYYFSDQWLQQYEYRIEIAAWIFVATGIGALMITLVTVSGQSLKAALMNPVNSLKSE